MHVVILLLLLLLHVHHGKVLYVYYMYDVNMNFITRIKLIYNYMLCFQRKKKRVWIVLCTHGKA